jgi:hypothetical protein
MLFNQINEEQPSYWLKIKTIKIGFKNWGEIKLVFKRCQTWNNLK